MRGVWTDATHKLGSVGVSVARHVTMHGLALHLCPEWRYIAPIVPCGLRGVTLTSLRDCGVTASLDHVREALLDAFLAELYPHVRNRQNVEVVHATLAEALALLSDAPHGTAAA